MLDDSAVLVESEDVDSGVVVISRPLLMTVENDMVSLRERPLEYDSLAGVFGGHPLEVVDESLLTIGNIWIVLDVFVPDESLYRFAWLALIKHQVVKGSRAFLVAILGAHMHTLPSASTFGSHLPHLVGTGQIGALARSERYKKLSLACWLSPGDGQSHALA